MPPLVSISIIHSTLGRNSLPSTGANAFPSERNFVALTGNESLQNHTMGLPREQSVDFSPLTGKSMDLQPYRIDLLEGVPQMQSMEGNNLEIHRLGHMEVSNIRALMVDVISRLPSQNLFAMDDENYLYVHIQEKGEIYGAYHKGEIVAYSVLAFPGRSESNLGREFGVPEQELPHVAILDATVVHESVRGLGLQRHFHKLREKRARENGYRYLYSTVHPQNLVSIKNLESEGFTLQFSRPMYGGKPRYCYVKPLL
jgi:GNAT superfamily N-acetyltransferase